MMAIWYCNPLFFSGVVNYLVNSLVPSISLLLCYLSLGTDNNSVGLWSVPWCYRYGFQMVLWLIVVLRSSRHVVDWWWPGGLAGSVVMSSVGFVGVMWCGAAACHCDQSHAVSISCKLHDSGMHGEVIGTRMHGAMIKASCICPSAAYMAR
jgi:hypothetical protein